MQRASPGVSQTINRVVEQTIEKVAPDYSTSTMQTVVVKEDDLVVDAISKARATMALFLTPNNATTPPVDAYSLGGGTFLVSVSSLDATKTYTIKLGNTMYDATVKNVSSFGFAVLSVTKPDDAIAKLPALSLGADATVKAGQTLVLVTSSTISKGTVESINLVQQKDDVGKVTASWNVITSSSAPTSDMIGSIALDIDGDVVGLVVPKGDSGAEIIGVDTLSKFISDTAKLPLTPVPATSAPATTHATAEPAV